MNKYSLLVPLTSYLLHLLFECISTFSTFSTFRTVIHLVLRCASAVNYCTKLSTLKSCSTKQVVDPDPHGSRREIFLGKKRKNARKNSKFGPAPRFCLILFNLDLDPH